ncbi:hypothetical protein AAVH_29982 [Aphelenchoides avenae]|nr:hypothetical protein AAVH_29982 [Aphelenchus avenae]
MPEDVYREYERSFDQGPESWEEYLETRFSVYVVKPAVLGPFFACSCPSGSKKEPCKHATMVMCSLEKTVEYPAQVTANEMTPNRKRKGHAGRDPLAPRQNRYAAL